MLQFHLLMGAPETNSVPHPFNLLIQRVGMTQSWMKLSIIN
ncbi:unnamed protein product [Musa banksii]